MSTKLGAHQTETEAFIPILINLDKETCKNERKATTIEVNYLKERVEFYSKEFQKEFNIAIRINWTTLAEVYLATRNTLRFLPNSEDTLSQYNIVGHLAFWIIKLKPVRVIPRRSALAFLQQLGKTAEEIVVGGRTAIEAFEKEVEKEEQAYQRYRINEEISLYLILEFMQNSYEKEAEINPRQRAQILLEGEIIVNKVMKNRNRLLKSFRKHNYSARAFATLIEFTFRTIHC